MVEKLFSNGFLTLEENLADPAKREILIKVARSVAKATLLCETNLEKAVPLFFKLHPEVKPTGIDEKKAIEESIYVSKARLEKMRLRDYQKGQYGLYDPAAWQAYVDFLLAEKELAQPVDIATLYTNDLIPEINKFDREAIVRQAKAL